MVVSKQFTPTLVLLLLTLLLKPTPCPGTTRRECFGQVISQLSGYIFYGNYLWKVDADFRASCQLQCLLDPRCLAFSSMRGGGVCVAYSVLMGKPSDSSTVENGGAMTYLLQRLPVSIPSASFSNVNQARCSQYQDCVGLVSGPFVCVYGLCQCSWGYFYSVSARSCVLVTGCNQSDYSLYTNSERYLLQLDATRRALFSYYGLTESQCCSLCALMSSCLGVNYDNRNVDGLGSSCMGLGADALDNSPQFVHVETGARYKQKLCN